MAGKLTQAQLKRVSEHQYSAEGTSLLEPLMQIFWRWLVEQIPRSWAPNALTVVGVMLNIVTAMIVIIQSPDAKQEVAPWAYILAALGMFIYQALDAIDGKQARRTNSASPLGELMDHGCDSVSTVFVSVSCFTALHMGEHPDWLFVQCISIMILFYVAHWQAYVSGTLKFKMIDVTEIQLAVILIFGVNVIFGHQVWSFPIYGIQVKLLLAYASLVAAIVQASTNLSIIFMQGGVGKNRSTIAGTSTIFPLFPVAGVFVSAFVISQKSPSWLFYQHPALYIISFGIVFAKITNILVVAHMTKSEMALWDSVYLGPAMLFINQYFNCVIDEYIVLWLCCIYCTYNLLSYAWHVCTQICDYLNIYCFTITSRPLKQATAKSKKS